MTCAAIDPIDTKGDAPGKAAVERPSHAEESRTLVELAKTCFLATASAELDGHPFGSMVDLACDEQGRPIFVISTLSGHTKDLAKDMRCSVTVQQPTFEGIQDGRVTVVGNVTKVCINTHRTRFNRTVNFQAKTLYGIVLYQDVRSDS